MKLAQYIHARWAADATLNGLLPVAKVATGTYFAENPGTVFATITLPGGSYSGRCSDGNAVALPVVRIQVHHDNYDSGLAIANAVMSAFNRPPNINLDGQNQIICMQANGPPGELQDPETGEWDFVIDFETRTSLPNGE